MAEGDAVAVPTSAPTLLSDFVAAHALSLTRFAYLVCGDRLLAEDLVQDTFYAMFRRFGDDLPITAPVAYARRSIVNAQVSQARRRRFTVVGEVPDRVADGVDSGEQDAMWRALATLPYRQRAVLVMRYYLALPDAEIAAVLDCRGGTVRSLAARAFAALRAHPGLASTAEEV